MTEGCWSTGGPDWLFVVAIFAPLIALFAFGISGDIPPEAKRPTPQWVAVAFYLVAIATVVVGVLTDTLVPWGWPIILLILALGLIGNQQHKGRPTRWALWLVSATAAIATVTAIVVMVALSHRC
jgi:hypothetical protein